MLIIPAVDLIDSKIVRLRKGDFNDKVFYSGSPVEQALLFYEAGFTRLHFVDLSGSKNGNTGILKIISEIKSLIPVEIELGGGIRSYEDACRAFDSGTDFLIIGSISVTNFKELQKIVSRFQAERIIIASDILNGNIMIKGWTLDSGRDLRSHINDCLSLGLKDFLCTDINRDGMLAGPAFELYFSLMQEYPGVNFIASGGIGSIQDIIRLKEMNMYAAVLGKAIYENKINLKELKNYAD